jgi:hypothetical protein
MKKKWASLAIVVAVGFEAARIWAQAGRLGGKNIIVRCSQGHLFTTIWIPGASVKALRLGGRRFQRCPIGHHWAMVKPVRESELTEEERRGAAEHHDIRVP